MPFVTIIGLTEMLGENLIGGSQYYPPFETYTPNHGPYSPRE